MSKVPVHLVFGAAPLPIPYLDKNMGTQCSCLQDKVSTSSEAVLQRAQVSDSPIGVVFSEQQTLMHPQVKELYAKALAKQGNKVHSIHISNCDLGKEGAKHLTYLLPELPHLTEFILDQARVGSSGAQVLANEFARLSLLKVLRLNEAGLQDSGLDALATTFPFLENLKELDLAGNNLTDFGLAELVAALPDLRKLQVLRLQNNRISLDGLLEVAQTLRGLPNFEELVCDSEDSSLQGVLPSCKVHTLDDEDQLQTTRD